MATATYPQPRANRNVQTVGAQIITVPTPRVRLIPFFIRPPSPGRAIAVSPRLVGPLIVESIAIGWNNATGGSDPRPSFQMVYGPTGGDNQSSGIDFTVPSGTVIFDRLLSQDSQGKNDAPGAGVVDDGNVSPLGWPQWRLAFPVYDKDVFLKMVATSQQAGNVIQVHGLVRVLEGVDPGDIANFL